MRTLSIEWQRLVTHNGKTCDRCEGTHRALLSAIAKLKDALRPLGMEPVLETSVIDETAFKAQPGESNRIWIAGKALEEWLGAQVGHSPCCSACDGAECRTVQANGTDYEAIPENMVLSAALRAAAAEVGEISIGATSCCTHD